MTGPWAEQTDQADSGQSLSGVNVFPDVPTESTADADQDQSPPPLASGEPGSTATDAEPTSGGHDRFDANELVVVCSRYEFGSIARCRPYERGSRRSPKVVLDTELGLVLIKRRAPRHGGKPRVRFCHMVQKKLEQRGYEVARLLLTRDGATGVYLPDATGRDHAYEAFDFVSGKRFDRSIDAAGEAGSVLGGFHAASGDLHEAPVPEGGYEPPRSCYHGVAVVSQSLGTLASRLGDPGLHETCVRIAERYEQARAAVDALGFADWPSQIVHGDWHPGNLVFRDRRVAAVLDLDSARIVPRCVDVAGGALQFSITRGGVDPSAWPLGLDADRLTAFLRGYDERPGCVLSRVETDAIPHLMIEALIAEAVVPIITTGRFGVIEPAPMLRMVDRKADWIREHAEQIAGAMA